MLQVRSSIKLYDDSLAQRQAAGHHRASIQCTQGSGQMLNATAVYANTQPEVYSARLFADRRFAMVLPCRVVVHEDR
jgi:hypothetical protein